MPFLNPLQVTALDGQQVVRVSCGSDHTLFLTADGAVLGCGMGSAGQLTQRVVQMDLPNVLVSTPCKLALPFGVQVGDASNRECLDVLRDWMHRRVAIGAGRAKPT